MATSETKKQSLARVLETRCRTQDRLRRARSASRHTITEDRMQLARMAIGSVNPNMVRGEIDREIIIIAQGQKQDNSPGGLAHIEKIGALLFDKRKLR